LVVNEPVQAVGLPFLDTHMDDRRTEHSPTHRSFAGLPPLCVVVSEHETVYDEALDMVNKARAEGVPVTVGLWKYMCHTWCFLGGFVPEGRQAMDFIGQWYREQQHQEQKL
jgi:epsilon-lactone hydrolase